ncbi:MAG: hypothetical protein AVDCRST_MAG10-258 [uncultured Acidimicrobiales bacterium]|uniref:Uncharacterized protein n=1 Tax=uncultured Acidimicrobiales bacterium TaxID=310071 RepID=A0A6J4H4C6_9ACTN|nr:MAG: hypothetical protein AVDCRST_MAG10-258 [uncultured Acidimicrobiales bacterium]
MYRRLPTALIALRSNLQTRGTRESVRRFSLDSDLTRPHATGHSTEIDALPLAGPLPAGL